MAVSGSHHDAAKPLLAACKLGRALPLWRQSAGRIASIGNFGSVAKRVSSQVIIGRDGHVLRVYTGYSEDRLDAIVDDINRALKPLP